MGSQCLDVIMTKLKIILQFILTKQCFCSVNVGANVGISNLFDPSVKAPLVSHSFPSYPGYLREEYHYQYPPSYDNLEVASSEIGYNTLLSDDDFINSVYDVDRQVSGDLFDVDRQVGAEQFIVTD